MKTLSRSSTSTSPTKYASANPRSLKMNILTQNASLTTRSSARSSFGSACLVVPALSGTASDSTSVVGGEASRVAREDEEEEVVGAPAEEVGWVEGEEEG